MYEGSCITVSTGRQVKGKESRVVWVAYLHVRSWVFPGHGVQEGGREARGSLGLALSHDGGQLWHSPYPHIVWSAQEGHIWY